MRFLLMIKSDESAEAGVMPEVGAIEAMGQYSEEMVRAGILRAAEGLQASAKGARVRAARGRVTVTDGPFAEAKELIAGFWIIEVGSLAEAKEWAARCPLGSDAAAEAGVVGQIEIRQITGPDDIPVSEEDAAWRDEAARRQGDDAPATAATGTQPGRRYLMTFKGDEKTEADIPPSDALIKEMGVLMEEMARSGVLLSGEGLNSTRHGARVTFARGKRTVVDGPFTETRELIAGFSIIRARDKAEAVEWARRSVLIDAAHRGGESEVDIRPIFENDDFPPDLVAQVAEAEQRRRDGQ